MTCFSIKTGNTESSGEIRKYFLKTKTEIQHIKIHEMR